MALGFQSKAQVDFLEREYYNDQLEMASMYIENGTWFPMGPGDFVPWPLNLQIPFPWAEIQGVWKSEVNGAVTYYQIKIEDGAKAGIRLLNIRQFEGDTCRTIAEGRGVERGKLVTAQMYDYASKSSFKLTLGAFKTRDIMCNKTSCNTDFALNDMPVLMLTKPTLKSGKTAMGMILEKVFNQCAVLPQVENN